MARNFQQKRPALAGRPPNLPPRSPSADCLNSSSFWTRCTSASAWSNPTRKTRITLWLKAGSSCPPLTTICLNTKSCRALRWWPLPGQLDYFSEIFQFDKLHPVIIEGEGACCPLENQVMEQNLLTLASRLPRRHQDVFRQQFRSADTALLETYPALMPYLLSMDRPMCWPGARTTPFTWRHLCLLSFRYRQRT